jgi:hypothetical protein
MGVLLGLTLEWSSVLHVRAGLPVRRTRSPVRGLEDHKPLPFRRREPEHAARAQRDPHDGRARGGRNGAVAVPPYAMRQLRIVSIQGEPFSRTWKRYRPTQGRARCHWDWQRAIDVPGVACGHAVHCGLLLRWGRVSRQTASVMPKWTAPIPSPQ